MNTRGRGIARGAQTGSVTNAPTGPSATPSPVGADRMVMRHAVNNFAQKVQGLIDTHYAQKKWSHPPTVRVDFGRRNARIFTAGDQNICWGWVDMTDGTIRRGSWKTPDMRVPGRGKISDPGIMDKMLWTGPPYL